MATTQMISDFSNNSLKMFEVGILATENQDECVKVSLLVRTIDLLYDAKNHKRVHLYMLVHILLCYAMLCHTLLWGS